MSSTCKMAILSLTLAALLFVGASSASAQNVYYPQPPVTTYYTQPVPVYPAPAVSYYYTPPVVTIATRPVAVAVAPPAPVYVAPVTTYRYYGPLGFPRRTVVTQYPGYYP